MYDKYYRKNNNAIYCHLEVVSITIPKIYKPSLKNKNLVVSCMCYENLA